MRKINLVALIATLFALVATSGALADGTETLGTPSVAIASGTHVLVAGTGNYKAGRDGVSKSFAVNVPAGATVKQVLLYWEGHATGYADQHCYGGGPGLDESIAVNGNAVTGTQIGGPTNFFLAEYFAGYRKDITSLGLVSAGANTLTISDMWFLSCFGPYVNEGADGNDGAGVVVIYDDGGTVATIGVKDGHDMAYAGFNAPLNATVPQTFTFPASTSARTANLGTLVASVLGEDAPGPRANQLLVTFDVGGSVVLDNPWQSNDGFEFDALNSTVTIPAGASSMTVQAISGGPGGGSPSSLAWITATVSVPGDAPPPPPPPPPPPGTAKVMKKQSGATLTGTQAFSFDLREGATATNLGTTLESKTANAANSGTITFTTELVPGDTYQLCETNVAVSWHSSLSNIAGSFTPQPMSEDDNSTVCVDFTVTSGETKTFNVNNTPPPRGDARTIGYWKNWSSCTGGNQTPILDQTLGKSGVALGSKLTVKTCAQAVAILSKSTIDTGAKMASDPAFNMAAQLLAAKLNVIRTAATCAAATTAINDANSLLSAVGFTGKSTWTNTMTAAQKSLANSLASTLDDYNNNKLC